jgi:uncharacterized protein (DUF1015 family)
VTKVSGQRGKLNFNYFYNKYKCSICVDVADIKNVIDNAVRIDKNYSIENAFNRGALQAGNAWDARLSSDPNGEWERWKFVKKG